MRDNLPRRKLIPIVLAETAIGSAAILGAIACLSTAFAVRLKPSAPPTPLPEQPGVWFLVPLLMLTVAILSRLRSGGWYTLAIGLVGALIAFFLRKPLWYEARCFWNLLVYHYAKGYVSFRGMFDRELGVNVAAAGRFLLPLSLLMAWFMGQSVSRWKSVAGAALSVLPGIAPCFVLLDTPPSRSALFTVAACLLILLFSQNVRRREPRETVHAFCLSGIVTAVLMTALILLVPEKTFKPPITWQELTRELNQFSEQIENRRNEDAGLSGNPSAVHLENLAPLPNRPLPIMRITTDCPDRLYLAGSAYSGFDGASWTRLAEKTWTPETAWPSLASESPGYSLAIEPIREGSVCFIPQNPLTLPENAVPVSDAYLRNGEPDSAYSMTFNPNLYHQPIIKYYETQDSAEVILRVSQEQREYAAWVEANCLNLPTQTRSKLLEWLDANTDRSGMEWLTVPDRAELIANLVSECAPYSRDAKAPPEGKDFAIWFLTEADSGYCVHYATTAAALLRAVGIPSRYVSGYIYTPEPGKQGGLVTSLMAHAWVEYWDGYRWQLLEPTPGDATEFTGTLPTEPQPVEESEITLPPPTHEHRPPVTTEPTEPPVTSEAPPAPSTTPPAAPQGGQGSREPFRMPTWAWWVLGVLAGIGLLIARRHAAMALRKRKLDRADANGKGILLYRRCRSLLARVKQKPQPEAEELGKKAAFSQHELTEDELKLLERHQAVAERLLCRSGFFRQLWYKYVLAIL